MPTEIDNLTIAINAEAKTATDKIDELCDMFDRLENSLNTIETGQLNKISESFENLSSSLKGISNINAGSFKNITKAIDTLSKTDFSTLDSIPDSLTTLKKGFDSIGEINFETGKLDEIANSLRKFGYATNTKATENLKTLKTDLVDFINGINSAGEIQFNFETLQNLTTDLSKLGGKKVTQATENLQLLNDRFLNFINELNGSKFDTASITELVSSISKLGGKASTNAIENIPKLSTAVNELMNTLSKSPQVSQNVIQMTNALANLASQGSKVSSASKSISNSLKNTTKSVNVASQSFKGLASYLGKFYANCFLVIRGIKSLKTSIENTADYLEAFNYFDVALTKIGTDWAYQYEKYGYETAEEYAESFSKRLTEKLSGLSGLKLEISESGETGVLSESNMKNLGLNIQEITQYAAQLASVTNSIGQTGEVSLATANAFTKLGADMSSLFNKDYSDVMDNLSSGLLGQAEALYKYGIDITNATLETLAYSLGIEKSVSEMTQVEKQQLRIISILKQSSVAWGDQANTLNSISNQFRQFSNNVKEAGMMLGQIFVPALESIMPAINGATIAIKRFLGNIASIMGIQLDLGENLKTDDISEKIYGLSDSLDSVADSAKKAKTGLRAFDELNVIKTNDGSTDSNLGGSSIDLTDQIIAATEEYERVWQEAYDRMENKAEEFADRITLALEPVKQIFQDFAVGDFFQAGQDVSNLVVSITDFFSEAIDNVDWYGIGMKIGEFFEGINWLEIFKATGNFMWQGLKASFELAIGSFETAPLEMAIMGLLASPVIVDFGSKLIGFIVDPFKNAFDTLEELFSPIDTKITEMFTLWSSGSATLGESFTKVFGMGGIIGLALASLAVGLGITYAKNEEVQESFENATQAIKEGFQPAVEFITNTLLPDLRAGWEKLKEILSPFTDFLNNMFVSIWQDMINPALTYIGETVLPAVTGAFENLWNKVLVPLGNFLADILEPIIQAISDVLTVLWQNVVIPLANAFGNVLGKAFEGVVDIFNYVVDSIQPLIQVMQFLWDNVLSPIADWIWNTFKVKFEATFSIIGDVITGLGTTLGGLIDFIVGTFTGNWEKAWNGVKDVFRGVFNGFVSIAEGAINNIINGINGFLNGFNGIVSTVGGIIGLDISIPNIKTVSLPRFELGGFVEPNIPSQYSLIMAGEHGNAELIGSVGGKTAVAGGAEITGISDTIRETSSEEIALLRQQNALLQALLEKEIGISQNDIGKAAQSWARDYSRRTGREAYSF